MLAEMNREPTHRTLGRIVLGVSGAILLIISLFLVVVSIVEPATGGDGETTTGVYAGMAVFFTGTAIGGAAMVWKGFRLRRPGSARLDREQRILTLAQVNRGQLTIAEVATMCGISVDESKEELDRLQRRGITDVTLSDTGVLIYTFPGLES